MVIFLSLLSWVPNGIPVYAGDSMQNEPCLVQSGGYAFVAWQDLRSGTFDIFVQKIDSTGILTWPASGVILCGAPGHQIKPQGFVSEDGSVIFLWTDFRNSADFDLYAQKIDADGNPCWTIDGKPVAAYSGNQCHPGLISDGEKGMIAVWEDDRSGEKDIYAQRLDSAGNICWTNDGLPVCRAPGVQSAPGVVDYGDTTFLIYWLDKRSGDYRLYGQRLDGYGNAYWPINGRRLLNFETRQINSAACRTTDGNIVLAWQDTRDGYTDLYTTKISSTGNPLWDSLGTPVSAEYYYQTEHTLAADTAGGIFISWTDERDYLLQIYAQHFDSDGNALWNDGGMCISQQHDTHESSNIHTDGLNGIILVWNLHGYSLYAQHVDENGAFLWGAIEVPVCTLGGMPWRVTIASDGANGAYCAWYWERWGIDPKGDIFMQRLTHDYSINDSPVKQPALTLHVYPNPTNGLVHITTSGGPIKMHIYDCTGRSVYKCESHNPDPIWVGCDAKGRPVPAGVYFIRIECAKSPPTVKKVILIR